MSRYSFTVSDLERSKAYAPAEIFFEPNEGLDGLPLIWDSCGLTPHQTNALYSAALQAHDRRVFTTVYDDGGDGSKVDLSSRRTHFLPCAQPTYELLDRILLDLGPRIKAQFKVKSFVKSDPWQMLGYDVGYFFHDHADNCIPGSIAPEGKKDASWYCNEPKRKLTVLFYLNSSVPGYAAPNEYNGGELQLTRMNVDGKPFVIRPQANTVLVFPSNFYFAHRVYPVLRGYRVNCVTWLDVQR